MNSSRLRGQLTRVAVCAVHNANGAAASTRDGTTTAQRLVRANPVPDSCIRHNAYAAHLPTRRVCSRT